MDVTSPPGAAGAAGTGVTGIRWPDVALAVALTALLALHHVLLGGDLSNDECISILVAHSVATKGEGRTTVYPEMAVGWLCSQLGVTDRASVQWVLTGASWLACLASLLLLRRLAGLFLPIRWARLAPVLFLALERIALQYSGPRLIYAASLPFAIWAWTALISAIERRDRRGLVPFVLATALGLFAHRVLVMLVPVGLATFLLFEPRSSRRFRPSAGLAAALLAWLFAVLFLFVLRPHIGSGDHASPGLSLHRLVAGPASFAYLFPFAFGFALLGSLEARRSRVIGALVLLVVVLMLGRAFMLKQHFPRHYLHLAPAIVVLVLVGLRRLVSAGPRWPIAAALVLAGTVVETTVAAASRKALTADRFPASFVRRVELGYGWERKEVTLGLVRSLRARGIEGAYWLSDFPTTTTFYVGREGMKLRLPDNATAEDARRIVDAARTEARALGHHRIVVALFDRGGRRGLGVMAPLLDEIGTRVHEDHEHLTYAWLVE